MNSSDNHSISPEAQEKVDIACRLAKEKFGIEFTEIKKGEVTARLVVEDKHLNAFGICFGTFLFNLADMAAGVAFLTMGGFGPTVDGNISFITGARKGDVLYCRGRIRKFGKKVSFLTAEIRAEGDTLVADTDFRFYHL